MSSKSLAQRIKDRLWSRFKVSVAEVGSEGTGLLMGVALVSPSEEWVKNKAAEIVRHLNEWGNVELIDEELEVIHFEDLAIEKDLEKYDP